jgi:hypothetical protein
MFLVGISSHIIMWVLGLVVNILKDGINPASEHEQRGERASEDRLLITLYPA